MGNLVDANPGMVDAGNPCLFQAGTYHEVYTTTDSSCAAIAPQDVAIGSTGTLVPGSGCTASSTPSCVTTISCSGSSGQTTSTSTLVLTTSKTSATGTATIRMDYSAPAGCSSSIFCPSGYCLSQGYCYQQTSSQTCTYNVAFTKT